MPLSSPTLRMAILAIKEEQAKSYGILVQCFAISAAHYVTFNPDFIAGPYGIGYSRG
jgi:hypothetical protein